MDIENQYSSLFFIWRAPLCSPMLTVGEADSGVPGCLLAWTVGLGTEEGHSDMVLG